MHKRAKQSTLLLLMLLALSSNILASETSVAHTTTSHPTLQHEPVQPIISEKNLNPDKVLLGETLFHDNRFGHKNNMSCATCHLLSDNGANYRHPSPERNNAERDINTLTIFNSSLNHQLFWDGRAMSLQQQIDFVVANKKEFASSWPVIIGKLKQDRNYIKKFDHLYDDGITADNVRDAIATFVRSLTTINSRFDKYLLGDSDAINDEEKKGYRLFKSYGCIACHQGCNVGGNLFMKIGIFGDYFANKTRQTKADLGRFNITGRESDRHVFRVPSLRLAILTPPYFHDGSIATLDEAIRSMARYQLGREISEQDIYYIIAFLKTLPGEYKGLPLNSKQKKPRADAR